MVDGQSIAPVLRDVAINADDNTVRGHLLHTTPNIARLKKQRRHCWWLCWYSHSRGAYHRTQRGSNPLIRAAIRPERRWGSRR